MINYSFIIPHHNGPQLLNRLLDSIPQREDIEIIVVDDNSKPELKPIINRPDVNLIVLDGSESKGAGKARNIGLELAKGKWLLFADSDDYYAEGFIQDLDRFVDSDYDVVYFDAYLNYKVGTDISDYVGGHLHANIARYENSLKEERDKNYLTLSSNEPWSKMFNREFALSTGFRFEEIPMSNDAWFVLNVGVLARKIATIDKKLYYYVSNPTGITNSKRPLSHYYLAMESNIRRNILKNKYNCWQLIVYPGFNKQNILRDYGKITCLRMYIYKLFHDPTFVNVALKKVFRS